MKKNRKHRKWPFVFMVLLVCFASGIILKSNDFKTGLTDSAEMPGSIVDTAPESIPDYSGEDYIILNDNMPLFSEEDFEEIVEDMYSELDDLGRCGTAVAMLSREMMPTGERDQIGQIKPSGWNQKKYEGFVDSEPPFLYNRSHLIAHALGGEGQRENLITGTRFMNATIMLPFEIQVMQYLDDSDNHVLYRISPYFKGDELVARGVEMEAYSVEDNGEGVCFHVFIYNHQPGIQIDYLTGESRIKE